MIHFSNNGYIRMNQYNKKIDHFNILLFSPIGIF